MSVQDGFNLAQVVCNFCVLYRLYRLERPEDK